MSIKQKIGGGLAMGAMLASVMAPGAALASTSSTISNNGFGSHNYISIWSKKFSSLMQKNRTNVNTRVNAYSNTGGNHSSFNTGGSNSIMTGNTTTSVGVIVTGNTNTATNDCGCEGEENSVDISDNGVFSSNSVEIGSFSHTSVKQSNSTTVNTNVSATSNTGHNSSSFNTNGDSDTTTGNTETAVVVSVEGGTNESN